MGLEIEGGVGDEDRAVVSRDFTFVRRTRFPGVLPARRRRIDDLGVVHQDVGAIHVRDAVVLAVDRVVLRRLQRRNDVLEVRNKADVHLGHVPMCDQPVGRIAAGRDAVPLSAATLTHQRHDLVGRVGEFDVDLAAGLSRKGCHPVHLRIRLATLHVSSPGHQVEIALPRTDALRQV